MLTVNNYKVELKRQLVVRNLESQDIDLWDQNLNATGYVVQKNHVIGTFIIDLCDEM